MKQTRKIIACLILAVMLLSCVMSVGVSAADEGTTVYFIPGSDWSTANARFAAYVWIKDAGHLWIDMSDDDGDEIYECVVPGEYNNILFCRMNPAFTENRWNSGDESGSDKHVWNQTVDYELPSDGNNLFTITNPWGDDSNKKKGEGEWSKYDANSCAHNYGTDCICTKCGKEIFYIIAGNVMKKDDVYRDGDNSTLFVTEWSTSDENNRMFYDEDAECFIKIYENVAAGEYEFKITVDKDWKGSYGDGKDNVYLLVEENGSTVVITFKDGTIKCAAGVVQSSDKGENPDNSENLDNSDTTNDSNNSDKDNSDKNEEPIKLNFFQKIWLAIKNFFANLFGGKK